MDPWEFLVSNAFLILKPRSDSTTSDKLLLYYSIVHKYGLKYACSFFKLSLLIVKRESGKSYKELEIIHQIMTIYVIPLAKQCANPMASRQIIKLDHLEQPVI